MKSRRPLPDAGARWVAASGAALAALVIAALATLAALKQKEALQVARERIELMARVLEEHATRSFDTVSLALAALADVQPSPDAGRELAQSVAGLPLLRSVALVDPEGRVLASSAPAEAGLSIDLARLGPLPPPGMDRLGGFIPGRGLSALARASAVAPVPAGVGFIPVVRALPGGRGWLLALVNPDAIANHQQQTVDAGSLAVLASFGGQVLAATASAPQAPGGALPALPVWRDYLPRIEHASYIGAGLQPGSQVVAFRAARHRPLVVLVETPEKQALAGWRGTAQGLAGVGAAATLVIAVMTGVAVRSVRTREAARRQRDAAQAEVAEREQELSVIVRSVQELIFRTAADGTFTFVNARWQAVTGLPPDRLVGRRLIEFVDVDSRADVVLLFAVDGQAARSARIVLAGNRRFEVAVSPLREGRRITGFAGSAVDVTARDAAQTRLEAQLAFSALVIDTMPVPVSLLDPQGRYLTVNRAWEAFTGRDRRTAIGQRARDALPPEEVPVHEAHDRQLLASGGAVRYEASYMLPNGTRRELAVTKAAVPGPRGTFAGILVCLMDISELREAERAIREARDAAEETSRAKSEFIANISHELRTPLQSIIGFSELGAVRGRQHERLAGMFGDIHAAGQRMLALVNDLLDVSKIESTVGTFHLERTDVRPLVREVVRELEPLLAARRLHVALSLSDVPLVAKVDPLRFQQVMRNVIANALKFSPEGSAIDVGGELDADSRIVFTVRDRGPGIPPAELETIFEAFVQSSKTKQGSGGTGLGLAICRKIVEAHGGQIRAENVAAGGSRFTITLPARGFAETVV